MGESSTSDILLLSIASAGNIASIALSRGSKLVVERTSNRPKAHSAELTRLIEETMKEAGAPFDDIKAIALSQGPGSYTGLRVGFAVAKGLAFVDQIPLIVLPTPRILAYAAGKRNVHQKQSGPTMVVVHVRQEEYNIYIYTSNTELVDQTTVTSDKELSSRLEGFDGYLVSNQAIDRHKEVAVVQSAARHIAPLAFEAYKNQQWIPSSMAEPVYFKPPYITQRKKKLL